MDCEGHEARGILARYDCFLHRDSTGRTGCCSHNLHVSLNPPSHDSQWGRTWAVMALFSTYISAFFALARVWVPVEKMAC